MMNATEVMGLAGLLLGVRYAVMRWCGPWAGSPCGSHTPRKMFDAFPGPSWSLPFLGDLHHLLLTRLTLVKRCFKLLDTFGPTVRFWVGSAPFVVLSKPEDYEVIIGSGKFNNKPQLIYGTVETFFGSGLATLNGETWRQHRKHITHAFHFRILERYVKTFERKARMLVDSKLRPLANGTSFNVFPQFAYVTNETIFETAFGLDADANSLVAPKHRQEFVDAMEFAFEVMQTRVLKPWLLVDWVFRLTSAGKRFFEADRMIEEFADRVIRDRRAKRRDGGEDLGSKYCFLDLMMKVGDGDVVLNDAELRGELRTFISVQQTSATIMSFALLMLALHPDVQDRVLEEALDELGGLDDEDGDSDGGAAYQALLGLKLLERVLKETMRLYPVLPVFARDVTEDVTVSDGTIPAGCCVALASIRTHRDPNLWDEPLRFEPDRFLPEQCTGRHPYSYLPFSAGARNCIGQKYSMLQMKAVLSMLLRRYEVLPGKGCATMAEVEDRLDVTTFLIVKGGFNIRLQPRQQPASAARFTGHFTGRLHQHMDALRAAR